MMEEARRRHGRAIRQSMKRSTEQRRSLMLLLEGENFEDFDRRIQASFRQPGGVGEEIRQGNIVERLSRPGLRSVVEALRLAKAPQPALGGRTLLELCHTHEGWKEAQSFVESLTPSVGRVRKAAVDALGEAAGNQFMIRPHPLLENKRPLDVAASEEGALQVMSLITSAALKPSDP